MYELELKKSSTFKELKKRLQEHFIIGDTEYYTNPLRIFDNYVAESIHTEDYEMIGELLIDVIGAQSRGKEVKHPVRNHKICDIVVNFCHKDLIRHIGINASKVYQNGD